MSDTEASLEVVGGGVALEGVPRGRREPEAGLGVLVGRVQSEGVVVSGRFQLEAGACVAAGPVALEGVPRGRIESEAVGVAASRIIQEGVARGRNEEEAPLVAVGCVLQEDVAVRNGEAESDEEVRDVAVCDRDSGPPL